jgi:hypothetical protein
VEGAVIGAIALLLAGGGAIALSLFEFFAIYADRTSVLGRIRDLIWGRPEDQLDMTTATHWLELAVLLPVGALAIMVGLAELGI